MGAEFAADREWNHDDQLDWSLLQYPMHQGIQQWVSDLNAFYRTEAAAHQCDTDAVGFEWIDADDTFNSVLSYLRRDDTSGEELVVVCNCTPVLRLDYRVGVPHAGFWREVLNSDAGIYGGSGAGNFGGVAAENIASHGRMHSVNLTLPPLGMVVLKRDDVSTYDDTAAVLAE
jgi:1,4-alpha-glucan branching enzyme